MRGTYDVAGLRADADLMIWWHSGVAGRAAGGVRAVPPHRAGPAPGAGLVADGAAPAGRVQQEPPARRSWPARRRGAYICVYPFVRSYEWYLLPDEERREMLAEHGRMARGYPDVRANTVASFALGDYEWMLAFEADELHRIVDLMRDLRASSARRHVREEVPVLHRAPPLGHRAGGGSALPAIGTCGMPSSRYSGPVCSIAELGVKTDKVRLGVQHAGPVADDRQCLGASAARRDRRRGRPARSARGRSARRRRRPECAGTRGSRRLAKATHAGYRARCRGRRGRRRSTSARPRTRRRAA